LDQVQPGLYFYLYHLPLHSKEEVIWKFRNDSHSNYVSEKVEINGTETSTSAKFSYKDESELLSP